MLEVILSLFVAVLGAIAFMICVIVFWLLFASLCMWIVEKDNWVTKLFWILIGAIFVWLIAGIFIDIVRLF